MAHFAEIDEETNVVLRVLVVHNDYEHRGHEFLADDLGFGGTWVQCSYNTRGGVHLDSLTSQPDGGTPFRLNYPGPGSVWDAANDRFSAPRRYESWSLDEDFVWQPPTPMPNDDKLYTWDEDTTSWVVVEVPE